MINFFFYIVFKKKVFQAHRGYPPRPVSENYEKKEFVQWKPMELGVVPEKMDEHVSLGTYILCM